MRLARQVWIDGLRKAHAKLRRAAALGLTEQKADLRSQSWAGSLTRVSADLDLLNQNTERDFLKIGGELASFMDAVNLISSELTGLANLMSEEQGRGASEALTAALDRSREMREHSEDGKGELEGMRRTADQLRRTLGAFQSTIPNFHILGVLTQIETARLGSASSDFGNLADGIKSLAADVRTTVQHALDTATTLIVPVENALRDIRALEEEQSKDLPSVISNVLESLASFRAIQERARESALRLQVQSDAISAAFMKVVVSIQFHDITRQQVEHVIETLSRLAENPDNRKGAAAVLTLQSSQLAAAAETFAISVASVAANLENVSAKVLEMVEEGQTLSSSSTLDDDSFLLPMANGCNAILDNLTLCGETEVAAQLISANLSEPIGRMRESIEAIQAIEIQMQRMGLNANIRAVHIGVAGDALSVLSSNMQRLAMECTQRSEGLIEGLGTMKDAATRLSGQRGLSTVDGSGDVCLQGLRTAIADLHSSSEVSLVQVARIVEWGARLRDDLATTRQDFSIGAQFSEAVTRACTTLKEIGKTSESGSPDDQAEALAKFAANYTMQSERDVYKSASKAASDGTTLPDSVPKEIDVACEDFELF